MARSNQRRRRQLPPRNMFWARRTEVVTMNTGNTATNMDLLAPFGDEYGANLFGFTVTRIRGHYTFYTPDVEEPSTTFRHSLGIRKDSRVDFQQLTDDAEQAARAPYSDPYADWMYARTSLGIRPSPGDETSSGVQLGLNRVEVDIKAQRKLSELGEILILCAESNLETELAEVGVVLWFDFHILLKQP